MQSLAEKLIETLRENDVKTVFGIPSIHNMALYEALRKDVSVRHILCRSETMAVHMADGFARAGQCLGVVIASTGPGTGYTVPAVQEAFDSCSPVLIITTNIASSKIGKGVGALHEFESQDQPFRSITKTIIRVRPEDDIGLLVRRAMHTALSQRRGPVYLEIPEDILYGPHSGQPGKSCGEPEDREPVRDLERAISLINESRQPLIIAGVSALQATIARDIGILAERIGAPVVSTVLAKGIIAEDHPLSFGNAARKGVLRELIGSCDLALAVGTRLREVDAKRRGLVLPRLIHIDWDNRWVDKNFPAEVALSGDISRIVPAIVEGLKAELPLSQRTEWVGEKRTRREQELRKIYRLHPEMQYLSIIRSALSRDSVLVSDNTLLGYWAEYFYPTYRPGGLMAAKGSVTLGFALAAAMGAKLALPEKQVVALMGDGGFLYSDQELATCVRHGIHFPLIVVNDNSFRTVSFLQREKFGKSYETQLTNPDFVALAKAYGIEGYRADSPSRFESALTGALKTGAMSLIELNVDFAEPPFAKY